MLNYQRVSFLVGRFQDFKAGLFSTYHLPKEVENLFRKSLLISFRYVFVWLTLFPQLQSSASHRKPQDIWSQRASMVIKWDRLRNGNGWKYLWRVRDCRIQGKPIPIQSQQPDVIMVMGLSNSCWMGFSNNGIFRLFHNVLIIPSNSQMGVYLWAVWTDQHLWWFKDVIFQFELVQ